MPEKETVDLLQKKQELELKMLEYAIAQLSNGNDVSHDLTLQTVLQIIFQDRL